MKLVAALGNPGARYAQTRHNVGFRVAERFAARHGIALDGEAFGGRFGRGLLAALPGHERLYVAILEPLTYMNRSGDAVADACAALAIEDPARDLMVVFDDVDLPFGRLRLRPGGGAGGHRGLAHIIERLGLRSFPRLRFGIGRSAAQHDTADHVLQPFSPDEEQRLPRQLDRAADALEAALRDGIGSAMNLFNAEDPERDGLSGI